VCYLLEPPDFGVSHARSLQRSAASNSSECQTAGSANTTCACSFPKSEFPHALFKTILFIAFGIRQIRIWLEETIIRSPPRCGNALYFPGSVYTSLTVSKYYRTSPPPETLGRSRRAARIFGPTDKRRRLQDSHPPASASAARRSVSSSHPSIYCYYMNNHLYDTIHRPSAPRPRCGDSSLIPRDPWTRIRPPPLRRECTS
jgi:hypothetical protein